MTEEINNAIAWGVVWLPIATAPRDGSVILLFKDGEGDVVPGWWSADPANEIAGTHYGWVFVEDTDYSPDHPDVSTGRRDAIRPNAWPDGARGPTHWTPMPAPPEIMQ